MIVSENACVAQLQVHSVMKLRYLYIISAYNAHFDFFIKLTPGPESGHTDT